MFLYLGFGLVITCAILVYAACVLAGQVDDAIEDAAKENPTWR